MTLPDKFAEASKQQLATHIDFFQSLTSKMFENAERILALNLQTTRTTLDQATGAVRQLAAAREPQDLLALRAQSQQQVDAVLAYSRKLFEIANQPAAAAPAPAPAPEAHIATAPPVMVNEPVVEAAATPAVAPSQHPLGEADPEPASEPAPAITAKATPIAQAVSAVAASPVDTPHPAASPMPAAGPIVIPPIAPVDALADAKPAPLEAAAPKRGKGSKKR